MGNKTENLEFNSNFFSSKAKDMSFAADSSVKFWEFLEQDKQKTTGTCLSAIK